MFKNSTFQTVLGALGPNRLAHWKNKGNNYQWCFSVVCGGQDWKIWNGKNVQNKLWRRVTESRASRRCNSQGLITSLSKQRGLLQSSAGKCKSSTGIFYFFFLLHFTKISIWNNSDWEISLVSILVITSEFDEAHFGKLGDFSFQKKPCWNAVCGVGDREWNFPPALERERQLC